MKKQTTPSIGIYDALRTPDKRALKTIQGGRLKGMTDIKPQWRTQIMTEVFGLCGFGWRYDSPVFTYQTIGNEINVTCITNLYIKLDGEWSAPIPGVGGSKVATMERSGVYVSDEAEKMALTDALSVAMKAIGVAADIYMGYSDSKYVPANELPDGWNVILQEQLNAVESVKELEDLYNREWKHRANADINNLFKVKKMSL